MSVLHVYVITKKKSVATTTLHTLMNLNVRSMEKGYTMQIHFSENHNGLAKLVKTGDRLFFMDYGKGLNPEMIHKILDPFEKNVQVLVFPAVTEGVDWERFAKRTTEGSTEPNSQRGLEFDTKVGKKLDEGLYECEKTTASVWVMDTKLVNKKLRAGKDVIPFPTDPATMFDRLKNLGMKIGVATEAEVTCLYTHECFGSVMSSYGVSLNT